MSNGSAKPIFFSPLDLVPRPGLLILQVQEVPTKTRKKLPDSLTDGRTDWQTH